MAILLLNDLIKAIDQIYPSALGLCYLIYNCRRNPTRPKATKSGFSMSIYTVHRNLIQHQAKTRQYCLMIIDYRQHESETIQFKLFLSQLIFVLRVTHWFDINRWPKNHSQLVQVYYYCNSAINMLITSSNKKSLK